MFIDSNRTLNLYAVLSMIEPLFVMEKFKMSQILHNYDFRWKIIYAENGQNFVKIVITTHFVISKLNTIKHNFNKIPNK